MVLSLLSRSKLLKRRTLLILRTKRKRIRKKVKRKRILKRKKRIRKDKKGNHWQKLRMHLCIQWCKRRFQESFHHQAKVPQLKDKHSKIQWCRHQEICLCLKEWIPYSLHRCKCLCNSSSKTSLEEELGDRIPWWTQWWWTSRCHHHNRLWEVWVNQTCLWREAQLALKVWIVLCSQVSITRGLLQD